MTGAGHAASFAVPEEATKIEGTVSYFAQKSDSGNKVACGFCGTCGSPVLKKTSGAPGLIFFHAGSLDDPSQFKPEMVVHASAKQPWDHVDPAIPRK
ncbi:MAG: GFA family protein [Alphaproteobacteria bacterium]